MTIYQEAHAKIDQFPEDIVRLFVQLMDRMSADTVGNKETNKTRRAFLATAGKIDIDEDAISRMREASII